MIEWSVQPEMFSLGPIVIRYYSLAFVISFLIGYYIMTRMFREAGKPDEYVEDLFLYVFAGTIIGARLGHCLFYDPVGYLQNPLEILKVWKGGLASHGAAVGILIAVWLFAKKRKKISYLWSLDRLVVNIALAGCFIRLGNLFNSEILGKAADVRWAFIFTRIDDVPRHPTQIYEALAYLAIFGILYSLYQKKKPKIPEGFLFGLFLIFIFGARFFIEFFKENQIGWESNIPLGLNMGQVLSIPLVLTGIYFWYRAQKSTKLANG